MQGAAAATTAAAGRTASSSVDGTATATAPPTDVRTHTTTNTATTTAPEAHNAILVMQTVASRRTSRRHTSVSMPSTIANGYCVGRRPLAADATQLLAAALPQSLPVLAFAPG